jgi:hypothetical protein
MTTSPPASLVLIARDLTFTTFPVIVLFPTWLRFQTIPHNLNNYTKNIFGIAWVSSLAFFKNTARSYPNSSALLDNYRLRHVATLLLCRSPISQCRSTLRYPTIPLSQNPLTHQVRLLRLPVLPTINLSPPSAFFSSSDSSLPL